MLIPDRQLTEWAEVNGTGTSYADPVVHLSNRVEDEAAFSNVFIAYPVSPLPNCECVRIDFVSVIRNRYSSELVSPHKGGAGPLEVIDRSQFKRVCLDEIKIEFLYEKGVAIGTPDEVFRHFRLTFGSYGRFDILARSASVRRFQNDHDGFGSQSDRHNSVLHDALSLGSMSMAEED